MNKFKEHRISYTVSFLHYDNVEEKDVRVTLRVAFDEKEEPMQPETQIGGTNGT